MFTPLRSGSGSSVEALWVSGGRFAGVEGFEGDAVAQALQPADMAGYLPFMVYAGVVVVDAQFFVVEGRIG
ncbi:hypothetical protein [Nonomuraea sp. NPDC049625]|uniref:hypothetical protein n=1 Tax=Nonomuraea sp. NPDC049625 TaxID=3155775 RepID=UPI00343E6A9C